MRGGRARVLGCAVDRRIYRGREAQWLVVLLRDESVRVKPQLIHRHGQGSTFTARPAMRKDHCERAMRMAEATRTYPHSP